MAPSKISTPSIINKTLWDEILVQKRDGRDKVEFDPSRILSALSKSFDDTGEKITNKNKWVLVAAIADQAKELAFKRTNKTVTVEQIQDFVVEMLYSNGYGKTGEQYVLFRKMREHQRDKEIISEEDRAKFKESQRHLPTDLQMFQHLNKYSRFLDDKGRRETWVETVDRVINFFKGQSTKRSKHVPKETWSELREDLLGMHAFPSMRTVQMAGPPAERENIAVFNCAYCSIQKIRDFSEILYVLMQGTGLGFTVEYEYVEDLPKVKRQKKADPIKHTIPDSTEGWCEALRIGLEAWFDGRDVAFNYSKIRPSGAILKIKGGRASGPAPLKELLDFTKERVLSRQRKRLRTVDVHDIACKIGKIVQVGGVRRAAMISLSSLEDADMRDAKKGEFWMTNSQRTMANNSAVYESKPDPLIFMEEWLALAKSGSGERGIFNRGSMRDNIPKHRKYKTFGTNPCFTGDTLVAVADGRGHVPFKQLAEEGGDVPVYTIVDDAVAIRTMRNPRLTGRDKAIMKITLDDGNTIRCTPNHKWPLRDGRTVETQDLVSGDSFIVIHTSVENFNERMPWLNKVRSQDYRWVYTGEKPGKFRSEHRLIAEHQYGKVKKGEGVHHKDRCGLNNSPDNLEVMTKKSHDTLHAADNVDKWRLANDSDYDSVRHDGDYYPIVTRRCECCDAKFEIAWGKREQANCSISCGLKMANANNPEVHKDRLEKQQASFDSRREKFQTQQCDVFNDLKVKLGRAPQKKEWQAGCKSVGVTIEMNREGAPFRTWKDLKESALLINHRVVSVEYCGREDVYNGTVDETHTLCVGGFSGLNKHSKSLITSQLTNQCGEIVLRSKQFCNLSIAVCRPEDTVATLRRKVRSATIFGTLQSMLTDFHYISKEWIDNCEEECLLGVDLAGAIDCPLIRDDEGGVLLNELREHSIEVNAEWADILKINKSAAVTCIKPGGNSGVFLNCGHAVTGWVAPYMKRHVRVNAIDPMSQFLIDQGVPHCPDYDETDISNPRVWVFAFPMKAPDGAVICSAVVNTNGIETLESRTTALAQLDMWARFKQHWTDHNPSVTINVSPEEWLEVGNWVLTNWDIVGGLSFLPRSGRVYPLAPMQEITKTQYNKLVKDFPVVEWEKFFRYEMEDNTTLAGDFACVGGACTI